MFEIRIRVSVTVKYMGRVLVRVRSVLWFSLGLMLGLGLGWGLGLVLGSNLC